jgi:hypothetical protein
MATTTALDLVNDALSVLQVLSPDIVLTSAEANDGLDSLNLLMESLSLDSSCISTNVHSWRYWRNRH